MDISTNTASTQGVTSAFSPPRSSDSTYRSYPDPEFPRNTPYSNAYAGYTTYILHRASGVDYPLTSARSRDMEVETLRFVAPVFDPRSLERAGCSTTLSLGLGGGCNLSNPTGGTCKMGLVPWKETDSTEFFSRVLLTSPTFPP